MPSKTNKSPADTYGNDLTIDQSSNTGVDTTVRKVQDGFGNDTSISLSDDSFRIKPVNDNTAGTFKVTTNSGSSVLAVDTNNSLVKVGASRVNATTQFAYFGISHGDGAGAGFLADTHYAIPFMISGGGGVTANYAMGSSTSSSFNDTNPATSLTISSTAHSIVNCYWHVRDNITIDEVSWLWGADTATGDSTAGHLMSFDVDIGNGSTSGDLSNGVVVADGAAIAGSGYEQIYYQAMTVQSADVSAGKVIMFIFASDTVNSDYSINVTVKYHIQ